MTRKRLPNGGTKCSACQRRNRRPNQRYCRDCHAAYMRDSRTEARAKREAHR